MSNVYFICSLTAGSAFVISGFSKLRAMQRFVGTVRRVFSLTRLHIDRSTAKVLGLALSLTELTMGAALVTGFHAVIAAAVLVGLLLLFSFISLFVTTRSLYIPCNCFGGRDGGELGVATLVRSLLLISVISIYLAGHDESSNWSTSMTRSASQLMIAAGTLMLASWLFRIPGIAQLVEARRAFDPADDERSRFRSVSADRGGA